MEWDPEHYLTFDEQRTRPARDLLSRVPHTTVERVIDLGCGPGNSTALLAQRWPEASLYGIDKSPAMLSKARASDVKAEWVEADIAGWTPTELFDVAFANASLHWIADHDQLLPQLLNWLRPGGVLAVQMPHHLDAPVFRILLDAIETGPWAKQLRDFWLQRSVMMPDAYYGLLEPLCRGLDIWEIEYQHILSGDDPVLNWVRGAALCQVISTLSEADYADFERAYAKRLREAYPKLDNGKTLFMFRRLFLVAYT